METLKVGTIFTDHFNSKCIVTEIITDKKLKPIVAFNIDDNKQCYYHYNQITLNK